MKLSQLSSLVWLRSLMAIPAMMFVLAEPAVGRGALSKICRENHWCPSPPDFPVSMAFVHNDEHGLVVLPMPATIAGNRELFVSAMVVLPNADKVDTRRLPILSIDTFPPVDLERLKESETPPELEISGGEVMVTVVLGTEANPGDLLTQLFRASGSMTIRYWLKDGKVKDKRISLDGAALAIRQALTDGDRNFEGVFSLSASAVTCPVGTWCTMGFRFGDEASFDGAVVRLRNAKLGILKAKLSDFNGVLGFLEISDPEFEPLRATDLPEVYFDGTAAAVSEIPDALPDARWKPFRLSGDGEAGELLTSRILGSRDSISVRLHTRRGGSLELVFPVEGASQAIETLFGTATPSPVAPQAAAKQPEPEEALQAQAPTHEAKREAGDSVTGRVTARIVGSSAGTTAFEWTVTLANTSDEESVVEVVLNYLDAKGATLYFSEPFMAKVAPLTVEKIPGMSRLSDSLAVEVARVQALVRPPETP